MKPPIIGITTYGRNDDNRYHLPAKYVESVRRAGAIPVLIPPGEERLDDLLSLLDGVIFAGGGDIDPARYYGQGHAAVYSVDAERDSTELRLAQTLLNYDLPVLGICRGMQTINVALGGTLIAHLPDVVGESVFHRLPPKNPVRHTVSVDAGSTLASIFKQDTVNPVSWHHQAVDQLGDGLIPIAYAPDGTIEALELPDHRWFVAVQWHPELTADQQPEQQRLFDELVRVAALNGKPTKSVAP
jgi:putative glutamine amidotransferase